jgi:hypothetical protein
MLPRSSDTAYFEAAEAARGSNPPRNHARRSLRLSRDILDIDRALDGCGARRLRLHDCHASGGCSWPSRHHYRDASDFEELIERRIAWLTLGALAVTIISGIGLGGFFWLISSIIA